MKRQTSHFGIAIIVAMALAAGATWRVSAQSPTAPEPAKGVKFATIDEAGMKEWLTYLASDELQGRKIFTEGYGLAAAYVADHLKQWGLKPMGTNGMYFQDVKIRDYRVTRNSTVTVEINGQTKTFKQGAGITFAANAGGKQTVTLTGVQFIGSAAPAAGADVKGKLAVWMTSAAPGAPGARPRRGSAPGDIAIQHGASGAVSFAEPPPQPTDAQKAALAKAQADADAANAALAQAQAGVNGRGGAGFAGRGAGAAAGGRGRGGANAAPADLTNVPGDVNAIVTPQFTADATFFDFLLSNAPTKFAVLKASADKGETLPTFAISGAKITINVDNAYETVREQLSRNVAAMIEGTDPKLKDTYVLFGAHLDHIGYSDTGGGAPPTPTSCRARSTVAVDALEAAGKKAQNPRSLDTKAAEAAAAGGGGGGRGAGGGGGRGGNGAAAVPFEQRDIISNGADDDGSGSTAELAIAKAFATGPKPKRSLVFIWHTGEEAGLYGSEYNSDFPVVPLEKVQAQLNMDMVGRDDCDNIEGDYSNSVFIVGDDRISTDLHNLIVEQNQTIANPLKLDYELNDANDPEGVYTRSDHYSYASKGIPIAFFTDGLHPDYHKVSDTVDKIKFPKMAKIAQLVYETGYSIADTDKVLVRDNKGPQTGFGSKAEIIKK